MSLPLLGCSMGDPAGIGPQILLAAAAELAAAPEPDAACLFLGDASVFATYAARLDGVEPPQLVSSAAAARDMTRRGESGPFLLACATVPQGLVPGRPRAIDGAAALAGIQAGAELAAAGAIDALVTAPLSKQGVAVHAPGFKGHTEFLATLDGTAHPIMLFAAPRTSRRCIENAAQSGPGDRPARDSVAADIALLTTHLPLASAIAMVRPVTVEAALRRLHAAWHKRFGREPVVGVAALNPHAGEHGAIGGEEPRLLAPAIRAVADDAIDARGPYPADSIFLRDELDVILALYHDQGTIMAKRAPWPTVNLTLGLSYVRTSPDHGTAYDLAGTHGADHAPMLAAMRLAAKLAT